MNELINFSTGTATLAIYDATNLSSRLNDYSDWWCFDIDELEEVSNGTISIVSLPGDGKYKVRLTDGDLLPEEHDYASCLVEPLGLNVKSSQVFIGQGESLPADGFMPKEDSIKDYEGRFLNIPPGNYDLSIYLISWFNSPKYWNEEYLTPADSPPDIVIIIKERTSDFPGVNNEPHLDSLGSEFLFDSPSRKIGPEPGMTLTTKVWKNPDGLTLKECGPLNYKPMLGNFEGINWKDRIRILVKSVNHNNKLMEVEYIETIAP